MRARLADVAKLAGVSVKTVSNVVNDYAHVTPATRERVREAIAQLRYRPNVSARSLRTGRSGLIALAVPELDLPYFAELAHLVIDAAGAESLTVLVDQTNGEPQREQLVADGRWPHLLDGLIFSPLGTGPAELAGRADDTPLVLLGERSYEGLADHVVIDDAAAARAATEHLLGLGRRRIAAIGEQRQVSETTAHRRLAGYTAALAAAGRPVEPGLVMAADSDRRRAGAAAMSALLDLDEPPDAVFCFSDLLALGATRALLERGRRVPEDVAVVGFDDIEDGRFSTPTLTTISPDKAQIAALAVGLLLARIGGDGQAPARRLLAGHQLVVRESTAGRSTG